MKHKLNKGITLVSLVVTIILIVLLAGITIGLIINNDILKKALLAKDSYLEAANEESKSLEELYSQLLVADTDGSTLGNVDMKTLRTIIQEEVQKATEGATTTPVGTIIAYSVDKVPTGYLKCEGQEVSRTEYAALFEKIGTTYGEGNGSTTFNVPDLRGEFLRGSGTATRDTGSGADVGDHQDPTKHVFVRGGNTSVWISKNGSGNESTFDSEIGVGELGGTSDKFTGTSNANWTEFYTSRPTNTSVLYCIKY